MDLNFYDFSVSSFITPKFKGNDLILIFTILYIFWNFRTKVLYVVRYLSDDVV